MSIRFSRWWAWIALVPLLAGGCKGCQFGKGRASREWRCKSVAYHEVLDPEQGAGAAPFNIERLGHKLDEQQLVLKPEFLSFTSETSVLTDWAWHYNYYTAKATYSHEEGLARSFKYPDIVYPMKRFSDGKLERVRFGFRSAVCLKPDENGSYYDCTPTENEWFLVADMTCQWDLRFNAPRERHLKPFGVKPSAR